MKIRSGFVSNSSSSSFIVGVGKVEDKTKFQKYLKANKLELDQYDFKILSVKELKEKQEALKKEGKPWYWLPYQINSYSELVITGARNDEPEVRIPLDEMKDEDEILIVDIANNEGDGAFSIYDESGEWIDLNHDIDLQWFSEEQQAMFNAFSEDYGIVKSNIMFGAGRNG